MQVPLCLFRYLGGSSSLIFAEQTENLLGPYLRFISRSSQDAFEFLQCFKGQTSALSK